MIANARRICAATAASIGVSLGIALLLTSLGTSARATVGGPETLDVLGYDPVDHKVVLLRTCHDESGRPREVLSFVLRSSHPDRLAKESWYREREGSMTPMDPEQFILYSKRLIPLEAPRGTYEVLLKVTEKGVDSLATFAWGTVVRTRFALGVRLADRSAQFADTSHYERPIGLLGVYDIPGESASLAIVRYCRIPYEGGYTVDQGLLLLPLRE